MTGPIEERRVRPWATVLRVPTAEGTLFFKEPAPEVAHEYRLIEILAGRRPELVTEVLFADEDGRMLMRDAGEPLDSVLDRDLDTRYWEESLPSMPSCRSPPCPTRNGSSRQEHSTDARPASRRRTRR